MTSSSLVWYSSFLYLFLMNVFSELSGIYFRITGMLMKFILCALHNVLYFSVLFDRFVPSRVKISQKIILKKYVGKSKLKTYVSWKKISWRKKKLTKMRRFDHWVTIAHWVVASQKYIGFKNKMNEKIINFRFSIIISSWAVEHTDS